MENSSFEKYQKVFPLGIFFLCVLRDLCVEISDLRPSVDHSFSAGLRNRRLRRG
jgi:hypothetical protein